MSQPSALRELWAFLRVRKRYWLLPIVLVLLLLAALVILGETSNVSPFVYPVN